MAYLKWNSYLLGFLTVATCAISMYQIHSSSLREYLLLIIITFVMSFFLQRKACCKHHSLEQRKRQVQTRRARTSFLVQNETRTNAFVHFSRKKDISVIDCGKAGERFGSGDGEKPHYKHARLYHRSQISSTKTENESAGTHALGARHLPPYYSGQKAGRNMQAAQQKQEQHKHAAREHTQKTNAQTRRKPIRIPETSSGNHIANKRNLKRITCQ